ncbi:alpha/beta fold hydrolase [Mucilaginibacter sp. SP1R1]|uniref:alpha/beta fold hydrolase n=1 Tax=Mucilaginibacter sp. SP1R1 TaxID=2723091 RepID=UPI00161F0584|nr:alpha/beta hydrolase [Mucilaginibacter sp. SP1R1]MBB6149019.1 pimeloyl-ACP methyl ester carboxylesterase [Mucilaginibacter sp. SP1R1]
MPVIKVNNREVHIQELNKGAAETVLLIHGMFSNLSVYYFNIAPILAKHFHVVMYDLKSHGMSERTLHGYDLNSMTDDLHALMQVLNLETAHLAGYSFGGLIALKMTLRFPDKIKKLIVIEAPDPKDEKARGIIDDYSREFLEHYVENFTDTTKVKMGKRQMERNHRMYEYLFYQTSIKTDMAAEKDFLNDPQILLINTDTLLLYGMDSNCLETGKWLNEKIKSSELLLVPGNHNIPIQEPALIGDMMNMFFMN